MKSESIIITKSKAFAIRIIKLYQFLNDEKKEFVMSKLDDRIEGDTHLSLVGKSY